MPLRTGGRAAGLRLRASDLDCEWGQGQEMTDTGEALLMAVTGRRILASPAVRSRRGRRTHSFAARRLIANQGYEGSAQATGARAGCRHVLLL